MWGRSGLIGSTGFVGGALSRSVPFARAYHSRNIAESDGEAFDLLVCAGAPAVMWAANANPEADRVNLENLSRALARISARRLVLISTIAVFDDAGAGYTESRA
jgi:dTDP-4-dehydrorhamnose reductase